MEIERKYLIPALPENYQDYPYHQIEQAYLCTQPVVRIRQEDEDYYLTYKSRGLLTREEYNLPLDESSYRHLRSKADGIILTKRRYLIPLPGDMLLTAELDIFSGYYEGLMLVEVEFVSEEDAFRFVPPTWFGEEVTYSGNYQNSHLSQPEQTDR